MRALVLGANGMLGHALVRHLSPLLDVWGTVRAPDVPGPLPEILGAKIVPGVDARSRSSVAAALRRARPEVVLNAIGVVRQRPESQDPVLSTAVNARFPHELAELCRTFGARLVHFSTDCVFSGSRGAYRESDVPDPVDLYGRTKLAGEVTATGTLTLRTSFVGWQLTGSTGLLEWFATRRTAHIDGWARAVFSGLSTFELARVTEAILDRASTLEGLFHVGGEPISKLSLLRMVRDHAGWPAEIRAVDGDRIDRSVDDSRFRARLGWVAPSWDEMVDELAHHRPAYERWRAALDRPLPAPARVAPATRSSTPANSPTTFLQS